MHGVRDLSWVGAGTTLPTQFHDIPVATASLNVFEPGGHRLAGIGTKGPVERPPTVHGEGQHAKSANLGRFATDHQRQNASRPLPLEHRQHPEPLPLAEVTPVDLQPFERLEERRPVCVVA